MKRTPEPELMDDAAQAEAYAAADFAESDNRLVRLFADRFVDDFDGRVVDLGCGPGNITFRFAAAHPRCTVLGVDGAAAMVAQAEKRRAEGDPGSHRCTFRVSTLPDPSLPERAFDAVLSNSLLHHLADPATLWETVHHLAAPGAFVLMGDLFRPDTEQTARDLVARCAANEPGVLRQDFYNSLLAAFTPDEVRQQLRQARLTPLAVERISERHLMVWGHLPT